jgi:hypothetical protein
LIFPTTFASHANNNFLGIKKKSSSLMKIRQLGAELFHVDRPVDMPKLTVTFHNFADVPKINYSQLTVIKL